MIEAGIILQNRYLVQKQIGAGGMGTVYLATDQRLDGPVAIKETLFNDEDLQRAFEREAQLLSRLRHAALPHVIDYFSEGDGQFLVMEYIAGADLSAILKQTKVFPVAQILSWADDLLDALEYLHTQDPSVVHRDIKPQNLKLTPRGEIVLLDFGLAKGKGEDTSKLSLNNSVFGYSRSYAPLEQIQGTGTDPRSDVYSLAATLYHLLTGKPPADALTRATAYVGNQPDPLRSANELNSQVPASVVEVLRKGLELNANLRWQSAAEMRNALKGAVQDLSPAALSELKEIENFSNDDVETTELSARKTGVAQNSISVSSRQASPLESAPNKIVNEDRAHSQNLDHPVQPVVPKIDMPLGTFGSPAAKQVFRSEKRRPWKTVLGVVAAVIILGGGGFAAWYASSRPTAGQSNTQTETVNAPLNRKLESRDEPSKTSLSNLNVKTQIGNNSPTVDSKNSEISSKPGKTAKAENNDSTANEAVAEETKNSESVAASPSPIVVKSAPPSSSSALRRGKAENPENRNRSRSNNSDDSADSSTEDSNNETSAPGDERRIREQRRQRRNQEQIDTRQRRVREEQQKLPTILGAPPDR